MVYLDNIREAQPLFIPKNGTDATGTLSLQLRNTIGLSREAEAVVNLDTSSLFYNLAVTLPEDTAVGEYEYSLKDGDLTLSNGLLMVIESRHIHEIDNTIEYEQYNG